MIKGVLYGHLHKKDCYWFSIFSNLFPISLKKRLKRLGKIEGTKEHQFENLMQLKVGWATKLKTPEWKVAG